MQVVCGRLGGARTILAVRTRLEGVDIFNLQPRHDRKRNSRVQLVDFSAGRHCCARRRLTVCSSSQPADFKSLKPDYGEETDFLATQTLSDAASGQDNGKAAKPEDPPKAQSATQTQAASHHFIHSFHVIAFFLVLAVGLVFLSVLLSSTGDMKFRIACMKVLKRLLKTVALRQVMGILAAMFFVRFGLEPLVKLLRQVFKAQGLWEKSTEFFVLREVYRPLELLFLIAAAVTLAENFLPQLIAIPKILVQNIVRATLSLTFVISSARVVYNIKGRMFREMAWELEVKGDVTRQRRVEAIDKLMSVLTLLVASVFGLQALGLDVNSVLAIGGIGGLAVGLAGREILENLFTGLIILSSSPFEVGEEILFRGSNSQVIEGIVIDVGWYRTTIRSFEREIFCVPNAAFSRNVVLNVTRKQKEWRFYEFIGLRIEDVKMIPAVVADMRKIIRQDPRIIQKLHRRVFLDKISREQISVYVSFYVEAANRDAFMAIKQDLLLAFVDCVDRNGAKLARQRLQVEFSSAVQPTLPSTSSGKPAGQVKDPTAEGGAARALPPAVDVSATPSLPPGTPTNPTESTTPSHAAASPASTPDTFAGAAIGQMVSGLSAATMSKIATAAASAVVVDDILSSNQDGVMVTGSWDEL